MHDPVVHDPVVQATLKRPRSYSGGKLVREDGHGEYRTLEDSADDEETSEELTLPLT